MSNDARVTCPKCKCEVPVAEDGTFNLHGRFIIGSKHGFYRCAKSGMRVDGRRRTRLGHQIQNAIAKGETPLPADPFEGFREDFDPDAYPHR